MDITDLTQEQQQVPGQTFNFALDTSRMASMLTRKSGRKKHPRSAVWKNSTSSFSTKMVPRAAETHFGLPTFQTPSNSLQEREDEMDINEDGWDVLSGVLHGHDVSRCVSCQFPYDYFSNSSLRYQ
jgi:hypothetical protein